MESVLPETAVLRTLEAFIKESIFGLAKADADASAIWIENDTQRKSFRAFTWYPLTPLQYPHILFIVGVQKMLRVFYVAFQSFIAAALAEFSGPSKPAVAHFKIFQCRHILKLLLVANLPQSLI